jgi:hypothetical protein
MGKTRRTFRMPRMAKSNVFNQAKKHLNKIKNKRNQRGQSKAPPSSWQHQQNQQQFSNRLLVPVASAFQIDRTPSQFNFGSNVGHVEGGVFEFQAERGSWQGNSRIVPTMGTRQLSKRNMNPQSSSSSLGPPQPAAGRGMSNVFTMTPDRPEAPPKTGLPRPIVIDGSNLAFAHYEAANKKGMMGVNLQRRRPEFSSRGIDICVEYFKRRGHTDVVAFVPQQRKKTGQALDRHLLDKLDLAGHMHYTPSRTLENRGHFQSYDDRYIVQAACINGGIVVSNDLYRDLVSESPEMRDTIENRLLPFNFFGKDSLMFPQDPLGKHGPDLDTFLKF